MTRSAEPPRTQSPYNDAGSTTATMAPSEWRRLPRLQTTIEFDTFLRRRLRFFALVITAFYVILLPATLQTLLDTESSPSLRLYESFKCVVLLTALRLLHVLHRRTSLTVRELRRIELILFGLVLLQFAWVDYRTLFVRKLPSVIAGALPDGIALVVVGAQLLTWSVLIIGYGILIPNGWRRCALIVGVMAAVPVTLSIAAAVLGDGIPWDLLGRYVAALCTWLGITIALAIYGSHRIEVLRQEADIARRLGNYRLRQRLGAGGMGEVYLAEHAFLRRPCAVKVIRPDHARDPTSLARFEREVQTTATLTHPNTVQIYDYGHAEDGTFYYVMEFLPGLTLQQLVERDGPLSPDRAIRILRQLCGALREAHGAGLIHCDIKPGNIISADRGGEREIAKLLDFGLVRTLGSNINGQSFTEGGVVRGTPAYMSPEQALGRDLDVRSDIYSLGAVAYFLVVGQSPFAGSPAESQLAQITDAVVFPEHARVNVPQGLQEIILQCLAKNPAMRFQSADTLDAALAALDHSGARAAGPAGSRDRGSV